MQTVRSIWRRVRGRPVAALLVVGACFLPLLFSAPAADAAPGSDGWMRSVRKTSSLPNGLSAGDCALVRMPSPGSLSSFYCVDSSGAWVSRLDMNGQSGTWVQLQTSSPGTKQTGHLNVSGNLRAENVYLSLPDGGSGGSIELGTTELTTTGLIGRRVDLYDALDQNTIVIDGTLPGITMNSGDLLCAGVGATGAVLAGTTVTAGTDMFAERMEADQLSTGLVLPDGGQGASWATVQGHMAIGDGGTEPAVWLNGGGRVVIGGNRVLGARCDYLGGADGGLDSLTSAFNSYLGCGRAHGFTAPAP